VDQDIRFDPIDLSQVQLTARLSPGQRIQRLLDAHQLVVGLIRRPSSGGVPWRVTSFLVLDNSVDE